MMANGHVVAGDYASAMQTKKINQARDEQMRYMRPLISAFVAALLLTVAAACSSGDDGATGAAATDAADPAGGETGPYKLTQQFDLSITMSSTKFSETRRIPRMYGCKQDNVSVPISWGDVPEGAVSLALLMESNQFPGEPWVHWLLWNIPTDLGELPEAVPNGPDAPSVGPKAGQGTSSDETVGWSGPCPEPVTLGVSTSRTGTAGGLRSVADADRSTAEYFFKLFALDTELDLGPETDKDAFLRAIDGHVIAGGELEGEQVSQTQIKKHGDGL